MGKKNVVRVEQYTPADRRDAPPDEAVISRSDTTLQSSKGRRKIVGDGGHRDANNDLSAQNSPRTIELMSQSMYELLCDMFFFRMFKKNMVFPERSRSADLVEVKVMATLVSNREENDESREPELNIEDDLCASHFVGFVNKDADPRERRDPMEREGLVTSTQKCAVLSRFVSVPQKELIAIPGCVDPGEAVSIVSTILPAFGALHHGDRRARDVRYSPLALKNKQVLITNGGRLEAQAAVKMAVWGGASGVFVLNTGKVLSSRSYGDHVAVLGDDPKDWLPVVQGDMDIVVDFGYPKNFEAIRASLATSGRLVCVIEDEPRERCNSIIGGCERLIGQSALCALPRASIYDFEQNLTYNFEDVKNDLSFLFRLLNKRQIRPNIDKYVKRRDVSFVQEEMRKRPMAGAVICEPWNARE